MSQDELNPPEAIAVIGMAGRFPGADNPEEFWQNLLAGRDCVTRGGTRTDEEGNTWVSARGALRRPDLFDASFFGIYPKEAALMDPQHRLFLECAWEALEDGGYDPARYAGMIGCYAGLSLNTYLLHNLAQGAELAKNYQVGQYQTMLGNDKDFMPVRVSYKLGLRGPSMAIQTACSTSLVAICQAATSLLTYQCDMALAGGVSASFPQDREYRFTEEGMVSPDGTCRAFDAKAAGTVFGHGCGVVLLKRLSEALADRDPILAVIKGWAVNNDGSDKIGFAAPGLNAQADAIALAHASAGVHPSEISYIEAHGTGTPLGDPIEIAALTKAFREGGADGSQYCAIGTGKTHIGHLDVAAGVTGLIKTIQQFRHETIPGLLHFESPNPRIDFQSSPFIPVARTAAWPAGATPRLAGISAFGVGGTNAHVVVEEPPRTFATAPGRRVSLLTLSARTPSALTAMSQRLAAHLESHDCDLEDVSFTLATGRQAFKHRRVVCAATPAEAMAKLRQAGIAVEAGAIAPRVAFLFPGQGSQYSGMGRELYASEPAYRAAVDECTALLFPHLQLDLREILHADDDSRIHQTWLTQPCIFVVEYALARLWISWGIQPALLIGHSIGEYVAAVLAGTFTLSEALALLAIRGRLMQSLPGGDMLAVRLPASELKLPPGIDLAAANSPKLSTVSGSREAIAAYQAELEAQKIPCRPLQTSHAFHSAAMEPIVASFAAEAAKVQPRTPSIPWISTCTGREMDTVTLSDFGYWARQLRHAVLFEDALGTAFAQAGNEGMLLLEVGPGQALAAFARQHPGRANTPVISSLPSTGSDLPDLMEAFGQLWSHGIQPDWEAFYSGFERSRLHLPTYPFERQSFWIDRSREQEATPASAAPASPPAGELSNMPPVPLTAPPTAVPTPAAIVPMPSPIDRVPDFSQKLRAIVNDLSGIAVEDDRATFTELGFDSLFLTQASQALQSRFGVKVTFRQMLGELSSVHALAVHLDATLPQEAAAPAPATPSAVVAAPMPVAGNTPLEQIIAGQIQLMQALLAERQGVPALPVAATAPASNLPVVRWPQGHTRTTVVNARFGPYKPIDKGENGGLTPQQQSALDDLISRYNARTPSSKTYTARHRAHYADPRAVAGFKSMWKEMVYPIVAERSKGSRIWDTDGNEYVDITMGFGTYFFGHSPDWLIEAVDKQLHTGIEIGPQSPIAGKLAEAICEMTGMDRATFCNTGSEAVMAAMRLARTVTGRTRIAYFTGDYHGMFEEVLVRGAWVDGVYKAQPIAPGIPSSLVENMLVLDYADPASLEILREHAHELAAVMVEPVQSRAPGLQPGDFMREVRAITRASGTALIFDEVVTGFRCHPGGAQAYFGVEADMATYGKVIGGGMPIGVLAGKREYMDALDGGAWNYGDDSFPEVGVTFFAGTFVRHPLALAAAWRVIQYLKSEGPRLQIDVAERVGRLCGTLNAWFESVGVPLRLPHFSAYAVIEHAPDLKYASLLWYFLREKGIHIWEGRPLYFTTAHTDDDCEKITAAFMAAVTEMQAAGFLPGAPNPTIPEPRYYGYDIAPTTEAQREIIHSLIMGDEANASYNESNRISFKGTPNLPALRAALTDIVVRHPALRSTFSADGRSQFFHAAPRSLDIPAHDFSADPSAWESLCKEESLAPFQLEKGPLVRLHFAKIGEDRHEILFTAHHLVCDGWSFGMILAELSAAYNARLAGRLPMLCPAMSFADYARQEQASAGSAEKAEAESFWVAKYASGAPVLELPTDRPRPQLKTYTGAMEALTLDASRYERLKKASPKLGGTLFATLLGAFGTLLHRLTGQEDLVIGVPAGGQTRIGCDELIGHCLNFLPLRLQAERGTSFRTFATAVKEEVLEAYDHQDYTFGSLLKKLSLPRDTSRLPLVSVMFNIDKSGSDRLHFDGLSFDVATNPKSFVNFELFFNLVQTDERLIVECEYNTDLHDAATIRRWLASYEQVIESVILDGEATLEALPVQSEADALLIAGGNNTSRPVSGPSTLTEAFATTVAAHSQRPAVSSTGERLSYAELDARSTALAARLQAAGVRPGDLTGICLERSTAIAVGLLAILKCGAAYVPMDPAFPAERLAFMVEDACMPVILTQSSLSATLPVSSAKQIVIDSPAEEASVAFDPVAVSPQDIAYVIFTSGSTGRPKGVRIPHNAVMNFLYSMRREPGLTAEDRLLSVTTLSFDISGLEIFLPLTTGAEVVIASQETTRDGHLLAAALRSENITALQATPSTWRLLLEASWTGKPDLKALAGGEAVPRDLVNRLVPLCSEVWNVYGPTETTIWSTTGRLTAGEGFVSIGHPIDNTTIQIVNAALQPQPVGIAGELLIGGEGLAKSYHDRPDLTADRFILLDGARFYRTGDLARWTASGELECLGRMDDQVKIRGFRIELGDIETHLAAHPAVAQAVASARDGKLVAYVRPSSDDADANEGDTRLWQDQWDMLYRSAIDQSGSSRLDKLDAVITSWAGIEDAEGQVSEWIDTTVNRIAEFEPRYIFEIGCGTGQLLSRLAPTAKAYWAADISKVAIDALEKAHPLPQVKLFHRPADDFSGLPEASFDLVIINSVAQYFPNAAYLQQVLAGAAKLLAPGGRIFVGDVQGAALMRAHHAEALRERAPAGTTCGQLREKIDQRLTMETELSVDPAWFEGAAIPGIAHVETRLRRGKLVNETTVYHYDAILHASASAAFIPQAWLDWGRLNLEQFEAMLSERPDSLALRGIPDCRLSRPVGFLRMLDTSPDPAGLPPLAHCNTPGCVTAEDLFNVAEQLGYRAHVRWSNDGSDAMISAVFLPNEVAALPTWPAQTAKLLEELANTPRQATAATNGSTLAATLRQHLASHLPDYMVPSAFVVLENFPLTPNGKVDRKALPAPGAHDHAQTDRKPPVEPRNDTEKQMVAIWEEVLGMQCIGVEDDVFELGGDSILIFQMTTRAARAGIAVTPAQVFRGRTISSIVAGLAATPPPPAAATIQRVNRDAYRRQL